MHMRKKDYLTDVKIIFFSPAATDQLLSRTNSNPRERKDKRKKSAWLIFILYMKDDFLMIDICRTKLCKCELIDFWKFNALHIISTIHRRIAGDIFPIFEGIFCKTGKVYANRKTAHDKGHIIN